MSGIQQQSIQRGIIRQGGENRREEMFNGSDTSNFVQKIMKPKKDYGHLFPKNLTLILSVAQCALGLFGIISQIVIQTSDEIGVGILGTGIWCGLLFGLSGALGIAASLKQKTAFITASMISSIISTVFAVPFFIISSVGTGLSEHGRRGSDSINHAMFAIQMAIGIIQIIASTSSSAISCQAICNCCKITKNSNGLFPKFSMISMKILSAITLLIAISIIIVDIITTNLQSGLFYHGVMPVAGGIWSGIIIGLSGVMGLVSSRNPSTLKVTLCIVFNIIATIFCFPLIAFSSIGVSRRRSEVPPEFVLCAISLALSIVEVIITICSLILACSSICKCCQPNKESGTIYFSQVYHDNIGNERFNEVTAQPAVYPPGYHNVPMHQRDTATPALSNMHASSSLVNGTHTGSLTPFDSEENPTLFTQDPFLECNSQNFENNSSKWQRFD